jgi:hypothetical protein
MSFRVYAAGGVLLTSGHRLAGFPDWVRAKWLVRPPILGPNGKRGRLYK